MTTFYPALAARRSEIVILPPTYSQFNDLVTRSELLQSPVDVSRCQRKFAGGGVRWLGTPPSLLAVKSNDMVDRASNDTSPLHIIAPQPHRQANLIDPLLLLPSPSLCFATFPPSYAWGVRFQEKRFSSTECGYYTALLCIYDS